MLYQVHLTLAEIELTTIVENWNNVIYTNCLTYGSIKYVGNLVCTMQFCKTFIRYTHSKKNPKKPEKPNI
jgi:hypothetical protein